MLVETTWKKPTLVAFGAVAGLAWAASLRGYMVELVGHESVVSWPGTFLLILLPGMLVGAIFGWAEAIRRSGGRRGWRWIALAPLIFPVLALTPPGALVLFVTTGIGGGALMLALTGMLGGYVISRRGPLGLRIAAAVVAVALLVVGAITGGFIRPELELTSARGLWVALLYASLVGLFALACSIPHRPVVAGDRSRAL